MNNEEHGQGENLVVVFRAPDEVTANIVKGILEGEGIPAILESRMVPMYDGVFKTSIGYWGDVVVNKELAERSLELISTSYDLDQSAAMDEYSSSDTVHLFVFDTLSDWEPSYAVAGINNPQFQMHPGRYHIETVGLTTDLITTIGGLRVQPDIALADLSPNLSAMLIIPGGSAWDTDPDRYEPVLELTREFLLAEVPVAAICGATKGLAGAGMLNERFHTSNSPDYLIGPGYEGSAFYKDEPAVTDGCLITASGICPVDFAYQIFKRLDLYSTEVLEAWYGLFKTGRREYFDAFMQAASKTAQLQQRRL